MTAPTVGPWRWWPCKDGSFKEGTDYAKIASGNTLIAKVLIESVTEADLRLMVAAPDLLAACKRLLVEVRWEAMRADEVTDEARADIALAEAAIAKATGTEP